MRQLFAFLLITTSVWMSSDASAYQLKSTESGQKVRWLQKKIHIRFHKSMKSVEGRQRMAEIQRSFQRWEDALQQRIRFQTNGFTNDDQFGYDPKNPGKNANIIKWVDKGWNDHPDSMAVTLITYRQNSGEIIDADIAFNGQYYKWYVSSVNPALTQRWVEPEPGQLPMVEVGNTAMHEIGHFLGFSHSEEEKATMFRSQSEREESKRELHYDDLSAISALYGEPQSDQLTPVSELPKSELHMGCSSLNTGMPGPHVWVIGLLLLFLCCRPRRTSLHRRHVMVSGFLFLGFFGVQERAQATSGVQFSLDALASRSHFVVSGEVLSQQAIWRGRRIYTLSTVKVSHCHKGKCSQREVVIQQLGGALNGLRMRAEGIKILRPTQRVLLFLYRAHATLSFSGQTRPIHRIVGMSQGQFNLVQSGGKTLAISERKGIQWLKRPNDQKTRATTHHTHCKHKLVMSLTAMKQFLAKHTPHVKSTKRLHKHHAKRKSLLNKRFSSHR